MKKFFTCVIVLILTGFYAVAQNYTYHPDDKEGMRIFLRQQSNVAGKINAEQLGLQISDTLNWYGSDAWITKVTGFSWKLYDYYRIAKIECQGKNIAGQLNGEKWSRLETLYCYDNELTVIDVSENAYLNHLACDNNPLQSLNFSSSLRTLYCQKTGLTALDLNNGENLVSLDCSRNSLTSLDVSPCPVLSLLHCYNNDITELDVSGNPNLSSVRCENNEIASFNALGIHSLSSLNISKNPALTTLNCSGNKLTGLDISGNVNIVNLYCDGNKLTDINLSEAIELVDLNCSNNLLPRLDVTKNKKLETFYCNHNNLSTINVTNNAYLIDLDCSHNWFSGTVDVTKNTKLETFYCNHNQITSIDVSNAVNLVDLDCSENSISKLDVTKNTKLKNLNFSMNRIYEIDLGQNKDLEELKCSENDKLGVLNVANSEALTYLDCSKNSLKELRTTENCSLEYLKCSDNFMLFSELYLLKTDSMKTFIYSPQKIYVTTRDFSEKIDLTDEYEFNGNTTTFRWFKYTISKKNYEAITLEGENGLFTPFQGDLTGKTLRCRMINAFFSNFAKDTLEYEVVMTGVGIEEIPNTNHIYPNPTDGKVTIQNVDGDIEIIQVFDLSGKMVFETRQTTFDIAHLPTAVYVIQIRTNEGILTRKLMKR